MEGVTTAVSNLMTIVGSTLTGLFAQPVLAVFFVGGLIGTAVGVIRKFKHA